MEYINFDIEHVNHIANDTLTPEDLTKYAKRPYFECPRDISFLQPDDKSFIEMFDWKNFSLDDKYFQKLCKILIHFKGCYGTSKFDVGKAKIQLHLPLKKDAEFRKQRASKVPIQLKERVEKLLQVLEYFDIIAPVNTKYLTEGNTFINPVIILKKGETLKIVLDARYLNSMIDETKCSWPIEPVNEILTKIDGEYFSIADMNSAYNQMPLDRNSRRLTNFVIGN